MGPGDAEVARGGGGMGQRGPEPEGEVVRVGGAPLRCGRQSCGGGGEGGAAEVADREEGLGNEVREQVRRAVSSQD